MAATSDEAMDSLLSTFDHICQEFKSGIEQVQSLQSKCDAEMKQREALEIVVKSLQSENERLTKLYTESLNKLADQLERRTNWQNLEEELKKMSDENVKKEYEHINAMESLEQEHAAKIDQLETQIRGLLTQKVAHEATINQLLQELAAQRTHIDALKNGLDKVHSDVELRYQYEIQDLRECLMVEQEEKNEMNRKIESLEKELLMSRTKLAEHQRDFTSYRHVETLKQKIMKLRKENEVLKRQLSGSEECAKK